MSELSQWGLFLLIGAGTFAIRLSFIEFYGSLRIPPLLRRALLYVPASVLAALVLPAVMYQDRHAPFDWSNPQIPAAILASLVAWRTRSSLLTLGVGMGALWALKGWGI
ncbi:AzlD domain-containing protein [Pseudomonas sp. R37(2017)]|uniref:AzlD domain-containing protein n=1 Tax=Pseudomonas sp. R37(2017) TaxID=1981685 RepID=UPI000A1EDA86|nr:AzlD domain-containing protein [Pseudomonas sp. R37(2017)]